MRNIYWAVWSGLETNLKKAKKTSADTFSSSLITVLDC